MTFLWHGKEFVRLGIYWQDKTGPSKKKLQLLSGQQFPARFHTFFPRQGLAKTKTSPWHLPIVAIS